MPVLNIPANTPTLVATTTGAVRYLIVNDTPNATKGCDVHANTTGSVNSVDDLGIVAPNGSKRITATGSFYLWSTKATRVEVTGTSVADGTVTGNNGGSSGATGTSARVPVASRNNAYNKGTQAGRTVDTTRLRHVVKVDCSEMEIEFGNFSQANGIDNTFYGTTFSGEAPGPNDITVRCGIEIPSISATYIQRVDFNGSDTAVIKPNGLAIGKIYGSFKKGDVVFERCEVTPAAGGVYPTGLGLRGAVVQVNGGGGGDGQVIGTASAFSGAIGASATYGPTCYTSNRITGIPSKGSSLKTVAHIGDSTSSVSLADVMEDYGYMTRVAEADPTMALVAVGVQSDSAASFAQINGHRSRAAMSCSDVVWNFIINDVLNGVPLATLKANALKAWRVLASGGARIHATTCRPLSLDTTTFYATVAGQSLRGVESVRVAYNDWLRAGAPVDKDTLVGAVPGAANTIPCPWLSSYIEIADVSESSRNSGKWKVGTVLGTGTVVTGDTGASGQTFYATGIPGSANGAMNGKVAVFTGGPAGAIAVSLANTGYNTGTTQSDFYHYASSGGAIVAGQTFQVIDTIAGDGVHGVPAVYAGEAAIIPLERFLARQF